MSFKSFFKLTKPCGNCPFRKAGGVELEPGRLKGIIQSLMEDDYSSFLCHKTVHNEKTGGDWNEDYEYEASGQESMCAGAMIYLEKAGRPTVGMRLGLVTKTYQPDALRGHYAEVIDP